MGNIINTSWVIRTKNEGEHIGEVLEMLQKQTRQDFEIIIVDSGSTDKTLEIVKKFPSVGTLVYLADTAYQLLRLFMQTA